MTLGWLVGQYSIPWRNSHSEDCEAFSVLQISGWEDAGGGAAQLIGTKPSTSSAGLLAVNGPVKVHGTAGTGSHHGVCSLAHSPCWAAYSGGTPAAGQPWGVTSGWTLGYFDGADFSCLGTANDGRILVIRCTQAIWQGKASGTITAGSTGSWTPYLDGVSIGSTKTLRLNWADGGEDITTGKELFVAWAADRREWIALGAECEA